MVGAIRRLVNDALSSDLPAVLEAERRAQTAAGYTPDAREGIAAFVEKRAARFTGA